MHAGALAYRDDLTSERVSESAELIQAKAHEALTTCAQVLGVLRSDDGVACDRPQPTFGDLPALIDEAEQAGMRSTRRPCRLGRRVRSRSAARSTASCRRG